MLTDCGLWAIAPGWERRILDAMSPDTGREAEVTAAAGRATADYTKVGASAVIPVKGVLTKHFSMFTLFFGGTAYSGIGRALAAVVNDDEVESVTLQIDSPGGSVDGLPELGQAIQTAREHKPVNAFVDGLAASAAYYLASNAETVTAAHELNEVGSIGVRMLAYDFSRAFEDDGIRPVVIDTGVHKSAGAMGTEITEEQAAVWQAAVNRWMDHFVEVVAKGRSMPQESVRAAGDGRMFYAEDAARMGLIDGVAGSSAQPARRQGMRTDTAKVRQRLRGVR